MAKKPNPMAKDLRQPKYRPRVIPDKKKNPKIKHKDGKNVDYNLKG